MYSCYSATPITLRLILKLAASTTFRVLREPAPFERLLFCYFAKTVRGYER